MASKPSSAASSSGAGGGTVASALLDERMVRVMDAALELHGKRATVPAIATFVRHLTGREVTADHARALSALYSQGYSLAWELLDEKADMATPGAGIIEAANMCFVLEVKARGKKQLRIAKALESLSGNGKGLVDLPPTPTAESVYGSKKRAKASVALSSATQSVSNANTTQSSNISTKASDEFSSPAPVIPQQPHSQAATASANKASNEIHLADTFSPENALEALKSEPYYLDQCCFERTLPARKGEFVQLDSVACLSPRTKQALTSQWNVQSLYRHQVEAIESSLSGKNVLLLTGTGSGKTLCFASVVAERINRMRGLDADLAAMGGGFLLGANSGARFKCLFLYPTKALAQDQLRALKGLFAKEKVIISAIDGDSSPSERQIGRDEADIVLTNPDMLHCTVLPKAHNEWRSFVRSIKLIVIDEAHTFNGAFGCHVAFVLRRLFRLTDGIPQVFICSATIGNPQETFQRLTGLPISCVTRSSPHLEVEGPSLLTKSSPLKSSGSSNSPNASARTLFQSNDEELIESVGPPHLPVASLSTSGASDDAIGRGQEIEIPDELVIVDRDTSPQGRRLVALWRPKVLHITPDGQERRGSAIFEVGRLVYSLTKAGVRTIAFCKTRKLVELVLKYTYDMLAKEEDAQIRALQSKVVAYRAGYTKQERRDIEVRMFSGELLAICATSALELGIDIGSCDCVVALGVSNAASTMQMFGRAGRKGRNALNICVCFDGALDRSILRRPESFIERKAEESAVFDVKNEVIMKKHLLCAGKENPLDFSAEWTLDSIFFSPVGLALEYSKAMVEDDLFLEPEAGHFRPKAKVGTKAHDFSIRVVDGLAIRLVDDETKQTLDEIEYFRAFFELYPGAIYLHQSRTYCVIHVDLTREREARCKRMQVDYYTAPLDSLETKLLKVFETKGPQDRIGTGVVNLKRKITGFRKKRFNLEDVWIDRRKEDKERFDVFLPPLEYSTRATWIDLHDPIMTNADPSDSAKWLEGIHAVQHLMCKAMRELILSHHSSIDTTHRMRDWDCPNRLLIFDRDPGGIGIADQVFERLNECLKLALEILTECTCESGCEGCVFDTMCPELNMECSKAMAAPVLKRALEIAEARDGKTIKSYFETTPKKMRRAKNLAKARADGTKVVPLWKEHLVAPGSEHVDFKYGS